MAAILLTDAGHGGSDPGSSYAGVVEKDLTLDIDKRIYFEAVRQGISVDRTRVSDVTLSPSARTSIVKGKKPKYCISNHINAFKHNTGQGAEILVSQYNDQKLAKELLKEIGKLGVKINRGIKTRKLANGKDYYYMHRNTGSVTTLIVEYGFIDNDIDRAFLSIPSNRQKLAEAVVKAICTVEGRNYIPVTSPKPAPTVSSPKPSSVKSNKYYRVVTGSFQDRNSAEQRIKDLKKVGFESFIAIYEK